MSSYLEGNIVRAIEGEVVQSEIENLKSAISRSPSSSNKSRTADTSTCTGSRAILSNSSDNTVRGLPPSLPPQSGHRSPALALAPGPYSRSYATARSLAVTALRLQQSAMTNHAPSLRQTFTYFPRSTSEVPSALCRVIEKRPS